MKFQLLIFLCLSQQFVVSQTIIKLNSPKNNHEGYSCANASDSLFVKFGHREDMGVWYGTFYKLKMNVPDGEYIFYVDDTLELKAFIKDSHQDSMWTYYFRNGKIKQICPYKEGKLEGDKITYHSNGTISTKIKYVNGKDEYTIEYYESGYVRTKTTRNGEELKTEEFTDSIKIMKPNNNEITKNLIGKWVSVEPSFNKGDTIVFNENKTYSWSGKNKQESGSWEVITAKNADSYELRLVHGDLKFEVYEMKAKRGSLTIKNYTSFPDKNQIIWHIYSFTKLK